MLKFDKALFTSAMIAGMFFLSAVSAMAQPATAACPKVVVEPAEGATSAGGDEVLTAEIVGGPASIKPQFKWSTTAGKGEMGSLSSITYLDTTGVAVGTVIVIEVEAIGYGCTVKGRTTIKMVEAAISRKFDEFGPMMTTENQYARLDNYAVELQNDPQATAVLLFYAGRTSRIGAINALTDQTMKYLTGKRGIAVGRIQVQDGGFRESGLIELWIVPPGGQQPEATPTLDPSEAKQLPALKKPPAKKPKKN